MNRRELLRFLQDRFAIDFHGTHGLSHWARVRENGLRLCDSTGANRRVVDAFALLHDSCREHEGTDQDHGVRGGALAATINAEYLHLEEAELALLVYACEEHTSGRTEADVTVQTCWDADRLDLGRVGIRPVSSRLCTAPARDPAMIAWAYARSIGG